MLSPGVGGGQMRYCCCLLAGQASPAQENIKIAIFVVNFGTIIYKYIYLGWLIGFIRLTATSGVGRGTVTRHNLIDFQEGKHGLKSFLFYFIICIHYY